MNNFELDKRAKELAAGNSGYNLARRLLMLEQELAESRREAEQSQQAQGLGIFCTVARTELKEQCPEVPDEALRYLNYAIKQAYLLGAGRRPEPAPAAVPDELPIPAYSTIDRGSKNYKAGWNACRKAVLASSASPAEPK